MQTTSGRSPMLKQIAEGVLIHQSEFLQSNAVVVQGQAGALLIDPGITSDEMACLANDLSDSGQTVVAGFSTHPHWDHLLWRAVRLRRRNAASRRRPGGGGSRRAGAPCEGVARGTVTVEDLSAM